MYFQMQSPEDLGKPYSKKNVKLWTLSKPGGGGPPYYFGLPLAYLFPAMFFLLTFRNIPKIFGQSFTFFLNMASLSRKVEPA
jgi:hypothetical protein